MTWAALIARWTFWLVNSFQRALPRIQMSSGHVLIQNSRSDTQWISLGNMKLGRLYCQHRSETTYFSDIPACSSSFHIIALLYISILVEVCWDTVHWLHLRSTHTQHCFHPSSTPWAHAYRHTYLHHPTSIRGHLIFVQKSQCFWSSTSPFKARSLPFLFMTVHGFLYLISDG